MIFRFKRLNIRLVIVFNESRSHGYEVNNVASVIVGHCGKIWIFCFGPWDIPQDCALCDILWFQ